MTATMEDIDACFRLLLGRQASTEEKAGHYALAGGALDTVVGGYLNSLEFQRRGLINHTLSARIVKAGRFGMYIDGDDPLIGAHIGPDYEPAVTEAVLERIGPGSHMLDVGANCGYFSLLACSLGATVYAFEPLERNLRLLAANRLLNQSAQLHLFAAAASDNPGILAIGASHTNGIVGALPDTVETALAAHYAAAVRIDDSIPPDARIDLIKIDVEGHEYRALRGARQTITRWHPVILTEFAPAALQANSGISGEQYLAWLASLDYRTSILGRAEIDTIEGILNFCRGMDHVDVMAVHL